jgi:hypothetical protein
VITYGIVGHEGAKFTPRTEALAREQIRKLIDGYADRVVSGRCHLGGIDIWAIEEARKLGIPTMEFPAESHCWSGPNGFKARNERIVTASTVVASIVLKPENVAPGFQVKWPLCYHCGTLSHVKSGGCWTAKQAKRAGRLAIIIEI